MSKLDTRGQISVMISVMMTTFILFFAFVINTGMLVNAKINLQNAADLAAYAGASVQARQLTNISYLNYEMRRQWKKFLYRIYVLGNHGYDSFPQGVSTGPMSYLPAGPSGTNFQVPTTCVYFDVGQCRVAGNPGGLPGITIPPANFMDGIQSALRDQLTAIEAIRQNSCKSNGTTNLLLNTYWLYNTDPDLKGLTSSGAGSGLSGTQISSARLITRQALGLGIVPKEILLKMRILTLEKFMNTLAQKGVTQSTASQLANSGSKTPQYERTISAFNSAFYTLGNFTFNAGSIQLDELLPPQILSLKPIHTQFDTFAMDMEINAAAGNACMPAVYKVSAQDLTLGFYKDPKYLTYYAVRLKAQAQILFSPFGPLDLQAYSVAQPFGSRIGPNADQVGFVFDMPQYGRVPSLSVQEGDPIKPNEQKGWNTQDIISILAKESGITGGQTAYTQIDPEAGYRLAMSPNPWEAKRYNIINDIGQDSFVKNFNNPQNAASIWAPLSANGQNTSEVRAEITSALQGIGPAPVKTGGANSNIGDPQKIRDALVTGLIAYAGTLIPGQGETKEGFYEGFNVVKIANPYAQRSQAGQGTVFTQDPTQIKTSWDDVIDPNTRAQGRVGYSVKFVSFSSIGKNPTSTENGNAINGPSSIGDAGLDDQVFPYIKH